MLSIEDLRDRKIVSEMIRSNQNKRVTAGALGQVPGEA